MTENRYSINLLTGDIFDTVTNEFIKGSGIVRRLNELNDENKQYKAFIKRLTNKNGEIVLMNGNGYNVKKILGDTND